MRTIQTEQDEFFKFFEAKHPLRERFSKMNLAEKEVIRRLMEIAFSCGTRSGMVIACESAVANNCPDDVYEKVYDEMEEISQNHVNLLMSKSDQEENPSRN